MQWLARVCVQRPVLASVLMLVILVLGTVGYRGLGVDQFPNVDVPVVVITTQLPGAAPEEIETDVTDKIEGAVNQISGVDDLNSVSSEGVSQVVIMFKLDKDTDVAAQEVRDKVNTVLRELPSGIEQPIISKVEPSAAPVLYLGVRGKGQSMRDLTEVADKKVRRQLETILGVGKVTIIGGRERQIHVRMDPLALRANGFTAIDVMNTLQQQNLMTPGGNLETGPESVTLRIDGRVTSVDAVGRLVMRAKDGRIIRLSDVARVVDDQEAVESLARYDGEEVVVLSIVKQAGTNTIEVVDNIQKRIKSLNASLPKGMELQIIRDNSQTIRTSVHSVIEHLIVGALLAAAVVLLFLGNARSTLIAALSIPISVIGTFGLMWIQGYTLNNITLLALALAVGIVIDDAIVVLENIIRFIDEKGMKPFPAAVLATKEIGFAVLATTLSLMAVFIPVAFIGGIPGRFLKSFGYTMAFSIGVSLIVSFSLTPMMSARLLLGHEGGSRLGRLVDFFYRPIERVYMAMLGFSLRNRWVVALACAGVMGSCVPVAKSLPGSFLPLDDKAKFQVTMRMPEGTSAEETLLIADRASTLLRKLPGVTHILITVAEDDQRTRNYAQLYVDLVDPAHRASTQFQLMDRARELVIPNMPKELRINIAEVPDFSVGSNTQGVQYILSGPNFAELEKGADVITKALKKSGKAVDVDTTNIDGRPEVRVNIDRDRAADLGVSVSNVATTLQMLVAGVKASTYPENGNEYEIRIRADEQYRADQNALSLMSVPSSKYGSVPLSSVVTWKRGLGPSRINRYARERQITILANAAAGAGDNDVSGIIQKEFKSLDLGAGYQLRPTGRSKSQEETAAGFILALSMAFVFMYLILAAQFESWVYPGIILASLPLTVPFAFISLKIFNQSINMFSMLGMLVLFGVVKKNSILQVDHTNHLRKLGRNKFDSLMQANRDRLRPILMTTIAFVAGMAPLILSSGIGSGFNKATASIVVGGQTLSLLLTLLAVPVIHSFVDDVLDWFARRKKAKADRGEAELDELLGVGNEPLEKALERAGAE
ncbi:MAG TPA: efflux RND transporter permease subunit [Polyangiaceae bacterium]|nr:efflux RND transporter permease subunit [Polyangiaceae bacterium]